MLLDEPTNHLDIQSKDILLKALQAYQGTILFVSHDQDFVNKLATDIVELSVDGAKEYQGDYELYLYQKAANQQAQAESFNAKKVSNKKEEIAPQKKETLPAAEIKSLERKIQKLEHEIQKTEHSFANLVFGTPQFNDAQKKLVDLKKELDIAIAEWEKSLN